jgi:dinuclear metal center YbgI/SA1388 family protein
MSVKCQVIMDAIDKLAPRHLAENWDNVGLLVGNPAQTINKILITLDVTKTVAEQAIEDGIDLIIAHHPLIFKSLTAIRTDLPQGQILSSLLKSNIGVYAAHTNLDIATGGVNDVLAAALDLYDVQPLAISSTEKLCKLVVFIPQTHEEIVEEAIMRAGAGHIGNYSHCSFKTNGIGTFLPLEGSDPFIGNTDKLEHVKESRLETIMPEKITKSVIKAMLKVHPYEEVAYDIYPLANFGDKLGLGRIGKIVTPMLLAEFANRVKAALGIQSVNVVGSCDRLVKKVAVCGGAGASLLHKAAFAGADVLVTGDVKYHEGQEAASIGMAMIDAGHFATEQPILSHVKKYLSTCNTEGKWSVDIKTDAKSKDIFCRY